MIVVTASELLGFAFLALFVVVAVSIQLITATRQWICKHDKGVTETRSCDAICKACGKNLGFIGQFRGKP